jgi:DeoR/GlpR family transcriptional regulator of sugar metabolism
MPIYSVEAPNGKIYDVEAPEGASQKSILAFANQAFMQDQPSEAPIEPPPPVAETGFIPSVKRGAIGLQSLVADVAPAMVGRIGEKVGIQGAKEYADRQMLEAAQSQERVQQLYPAAVPSYTDIKGGKDLYNYVIESVGELIPSMIPSILTGGAAGIAGRGAVIAAEQAAKKASMDAAQKTMLSYSGSKLSQQELVNLAKADAIKAGQDAANKVALKYQAAGAVAGSAAQNVPEVYQNVAQETGKEDLGAALLFGGFNSVLDAITPLTLLRKAKGVGLTEKELIGAWYKRAGKGVLTGFATEGSTEAVQEMSSAAAEKFVDNNKQFFTPQNFERFINAGLKGGIGGGVASGATNVAFGSKEAKAVPPPPAGVATEEGAPPTEPTAPEGRLSKEEALAKVAAAVGIKPEEATNVNQPTFTQASGTSPEVLSEPGGAVSAEGAITPRPAGVADIAGATSLIEGGERTEQRPLTEAPVEAVAPEVVPPEEVIVAKTLTEQTKAAEGQPDFLDWLESKGHNITDGSLDWPALETQWKADTGNTTALTPTEQVKTELTAKEIPVVTPVAEEAKAAPAVVEEVITTPEVKKTLNAKAPRTQAEHNQKIQTIKKKQQKIRSELALKPIAPADKDATIASSNYLAAADEDIAQALKYLAFDLATKSPMNHFKPGTGGKYAQNFYKSLTPEQKASVDKQQADMEALETKAAKEDKARSEASKKKAKLKKATTEQLTKKVAVKKEGKLEDIIGGIPEIEEEFINPMDYLAAVDEMFGGSTSKFRGHILHGDLRNALQEIVADKTDAFTTLDKEVAKRLLSAKTLPAIEVVDSLPDGAFGSYNTGTDTISITKDALNSHIALHEAIHGYTTTLIRNWEKGNVSNRGIEDLSKLYKYLQDSHPELADEYAFTTKDLAEFASEVMSNRSFQDKLKAIPYQRSNVFTEFARAVLRMLGISPTDKFSALASALISVDSALTKGREFQETAEFVTPETAKFEGKAQKGPLKPELRGIATPEEWINSMAGAAEAPNSNVIKKAFTSVQGAKELARLFQNERYPVKNWQDLLEMAGKIVHAGDNQTNIYTQISLSTGRAEDEYLVNMANPSAELYKAIGNYATAKGIKEDVALKELQAIFVALHEGERRQAKYIMTVPLTADAAAQRKAILELVRSNKIDEDTAKTLRTMLDDLVENNKMQAGFDDNGPSNLPLDINDDIYNVAGIRPAVIAQTLAKYYEPNKELITPIKDTLQTVHNATIELNRRGNYWSQPVSNIVAFYGFENYVPLKGKPGEVQAKVDDLLNFDSQYNGREMQEATYAYDGRVSEADNVLLQSLSDGVRAALRAGRGGTAADGTQFGISQTVKNAINQKLVAGRKIKTIKFEDRYKMDADQDLKAKGETTFFHYNPDGSIEIYEISDKRLREAIRRTYRTSQPLLDAANNITSFIGQLHTRYNVAFAPMNFIRDTLTNSFTMGAEMGPGVIGAVASKVAQGGFRRAMKVSRLYKNGKFDEIAKLGEKDPYIKAMYEYIQLGGKVSYVQGVGIQSQFEQLQENIGRKGIATTKEQIDGVIDLWGNMFEFASRTAAYQVTKDKFMQDGLPENEAMVKAAGYVKNLANFEQTGVWGKQLGSLFMFFRPAATGAVRAIEALVPLWRNVDNALANLPESVRNDPAAVEKFRQNMEQQRRSAMAMSMSLAGSGALVYLMSLTMAEDDEDGRNQVATDDMARWSRYARFHVPGTDVVFQIPWGFGLGSFAAAGAQVMAFGLGKNSLKDTFNNIKDIGLDSFLPLPASKINIWENPAAWAMDSATPSAFRPFLEYVMNMDGLGREIYNNRQTRSGDAYTGGDNIPELYKNAARLFANVTGGAVDWSPNTMYFFANSYADGLTRLVHNSYNIGLVGAGQKDFNPKTDTLLFDSFFGAKSNFDARQFSKVESQIKDMERKLNMFKNDPAVYMDYISEHPFEQGIVDVYNKAINGDLKETRALANKYRASPDLSLKERKELLENVKEQQNLIKRHLIEVFDAYDVKP